MKKETLYKRLTVVMLLIAMIMASQVLAVVNNLPGVKTINAENNTEKLVSVTESTWVMRDDYGTFIVDHDVKLENKRVAVFGQVKLILADGCTWEIEEGIHLHPNSSLTIYAQDEQTGKLLITNPIKQYAGIGGDPERDAGDINIYGGIIDVTGGLSAAGIGGGFGGNGGNVNIYGGYVTVRSKSYGAAIGSGSAENKTGVHGGNITIHGGTVIATGGSDAAAIGGGWGASSGTVTIKGGNVTATGGEEVDGRGGAGIGTGANNKELPGVSAGTVIIEGGTVNATGTGYAAGIGGGEYVSGADVTISGGDVTAKGGDKGAGIGGGEDRSGGQVTITGGIVKATGGKYAAGIGGGEGGSQGGKITISDGTVIATGGDYGAGIGGGQHYYGGGNGGEVEINGGSITANGGIDAAGIGGGEDGDGGTFIINDGEVTATGNSYGAGIGGGENGDAGTIKIKGGKVEANAGRDGKSLALGAGAGGSEGVNFAVYDKARVSAGNSKDALVLAQNENRASEATSKKNVVVEKCTHTADQYTSSNQGHVCTCTYCNESALGVQPHEFNSDHICKICGYEAITHEINFNNYDDTLLKKMQVEEYAIPVYDGETPQRPDDDQYTYTFTGWDPQLAEVTGDATYKAVFTGTKYLFDITFDINGADSGTIETQHLKKGETIKKPTDPEKEGYSFAGWYLSDDTSSQWDFDKAIDDDVALKAQWMEKSYETTIDGVDVRVMDYDASDKESISNLYNDLPLLVKTSNGYVYVPANTEGPIIIPDRESLLGKADLLSGFAYSETDEVYIIYLKVEDMDSVDEEIHKDAARNDYKEVIGSGFKAKLNKETIPVQNEAEKYDNSNQVTIMINLKELGVTLEDAPPGMNRTYYLAHNYDGINIEYLPVIISSDKVWAIFKTDSMSPFALVYKDSKKAQPQPAYAIPVTGIE